MANLPNDLRLSFIVRNGLVNKPEEYIKGIYSNARKFAAKHGAWVVRLGVGGTGYAPNYRIEFATSPEEATREAIESGLKGDAYVPALEALTAANTMYGGTSHKVLKHGLADDKWSSVTDNEEDIRAILQIFVDQRAAQRRKD